MKFLETSFTHSTPTSCSLISLSHMPSISLETAGAGELLPIHHYATLKPRSQWEILNLQSLNGWRSYKSLMDKSRAQLHDQRAFVTLCWASEMPSFPGWQPRTHQRQSPLKANQAMSMIWDKWPRDESIRIESLMRVQRESAGQGPRYFRGTFLRSEPSGKWIFPPQVSTGLGLSSVTQEKSPGLTEPEIRNTYHSRQEPWRPSGLTSIRWSMRSLRIQKTLVAQGYWFFQSCKDLWINGLRSHLEIEQEEA